MEWLRRAVCRQSASVKRSGRGGRFDAHPSFHTVGEVGYNRFTMTRSRSAVDSTGPIILFDAECVLCSANAQFVLERDRDAVFRLASMQGDVGQALYRKYGMDPNDPASMLLVEHDRMRRDSDAVLSIYERLGFPWNLVRAFRILPASLRDPVYRFVARNRYRLFGRRDSCWVAPDRYRERIL